MNFELLFRPFLLLQIKSMYFWKLKAVLFAVFLPTCLFSQTYHNPCEADGNPIEFGTSEDPVLLNGTLSGISPFITDLAGGLIQDFGINGADSSAFYKLEIDPQARELYVEFIDATVSDLSIGLISFGSVECPGGSGTDFGEEVWQGILGNELLVNDISFQGNVTFGLCGIQESQGSNENIFLWVASSEVGDFNIEVTQFLGPEYDDCENRFEVGRVLSDASDIVCPENLTNLHACPATYAREDVNIPMGVDMGCVLDPIGFLNSGVWIEFTTDDIADRMDLELIHQNPTDITLILFEPNPDCSELNAILCEKDDNGNGEIDLRIIDVEPLTTYYIFVSTDSDDAGEFDLCINVQPELRCILPSAYYFNHTAVNCSLDELVGECLDMGEPDRDVIWPSCRCCNFQNPQWFTFLANDTQLDIEMFISECANGQGVQLALYEIPCDVNFDPGGNSFPIEIDPASLVFPSPGCNYALNSQNGIFNFRAPTEVGQVYGLVIDGVGGDQCKVEFLDIVAGGGPPPGMSNDGLEPPEFVDGLFGFDQDTICLGAEEVPFERIGVVFGACEYVWTKIDEDGNVEVLSGTGDESREVDFLEAGEFQICVQASNLCNLSDPVCKTIWVEELQPRTVIDTICKRVPYDWIGPFGNVLLNLPGFDINGDFFYIETASNQYGCEVSSNLSLFVIPDNFDEKTPISGIICSGDSYTAPNGDQFYVSGTYGANPEIFGDPIAIPQETFPQCDSFFVLDLAVLDFFTREFFGPECNDGIFTISMDNPTFDPPIWDPDMSVSFEWVRRSDGEVIHSGSNVNEPEFDLNIDTSDFINGEETFELTFSMQFQGEPEDSCFSGPFSFTIDLDDYFPPSPEVLAPDTLCQGSIADLFIEDFNSNDSLTHYIWEFSGQVDSIFYAEMGEEIRVAFTEIGLIEVCAHARNVCGRGESTCVNVLVSDSPPIFAGDNDVSCDEEYTLNGDGENGMWQLVSAPAGGEVVFSDDSNPGSEVHFSQGIFGNYTFQWTEFFGAEEGCRTSDSVTIAYQEGPIGFDIQYTCDSLGLEYVATFEILGEGEPYTIIQGDGLIEGSQFTSEPISSGNQMEVIIADSNNCQSSVITLSRECDCVTSAGALDITPIDLCEGNCLDAAGAYNLSEQQYVPSQDTFLFFLQNSSVFSTNPNNWLAVSGSGEFCPTNFTVDFNQPYYLFVAVGLIEDFGSLSLIDFDDPCLSVTQGKRVVWREQPNATAGFNFQTCETEYGLNGNLNVGTGSWTVLSGSLDLQFSDITDPNSNISLLNEDDCGLYLLEWNVTNFGCTDSSEVTIEFLCNPELVSNSLEYECFENIFYSVQFEIESGQAPFSEDDDRGSFDGNLFSISGIEAGTSDTFHITDANGCSISVPVFRDCECQSLAGQMSAELIDVCESDGEITVDAFEQDPVIASGDIGIFILHDSPGPALGANVIGMNTDGAFEFDALEMDCGTTYYISHVTGPSPAPDSVDLESSCLEVAPGQPVLWRCSPEANAGDDSETCGLTYNLTAAFSTGNQGNWTALTGGIFEDSNSPLTEVEVPTYGTYCFSWTEINGECEDSDEVCITFYDSPEGEITGIECDNSGTFYQLTIEIEGGEEGTYTINGESISGSDFTSEPIPSQSSYSFVIKDANQCDSIILSGSHTCDCLSQTGDLSQESLVLCEDEVVTTTDFYDSEDEFLDGNDILVFILHSEIPIESNNIVESNSSGVFSFDASGGMQYGNTYFITVAVGDSLNGSVDLDDPCIQFTTQLEVSWFEYPNADIEQDIDTLTCDQTTVDLEAINDSPNVIYEWSSNNGEILTGTENNRIAQVLAPGRYDLLVTDTVSSCSSNSFIWVTENVEVPDVEILDPSELNCIVTEIPLEGFVSAPVSDYTVEWFGPGIVSNENEIQILVNEPGEYTLQVTDLSNGCTGSDIVVVNSDIDEPIAIASVNDELDCSTDEVVVSGEGSSEGSAYEYSWVVLGPQGNIINGQNSIEATVNEAGIYEFTVVNLDDGCESKDTVEVIEITDVITAVEVSTTDLNCFGDRDGSILIEEVIGGTPPYLYSFDGGPFGNSAELFNVNPGEYFFEVRDARGCLFMDSVVITEPPLLTVDLGEDLIVELGEMVTLFADVNTDPNFIAFWNWNPIVDVQCPNCQEQKFSPERDTIINIEVVDSAGCVATDHIEIEVNLTRTLFIPNAFSPNGDGINDFFGVYTQPAKIRSIPVFRIFDRWGEQLFERENLDAPVELNSTNSWDGTFNGELMQVGVYVYYIEVEFVDGKVEVYQGDFLLAR